MELKETVDLMLSEDYKDRLKAEYYQLKNRYEGLAKFLADWYEGKLNFTPAGLIESRYEQLEAMAGYKLALEKVMQENGIDL